MKLILERRKKGNRKNISKDWYRKIEESKCNTKYKYIMELLEYLCEKGNMVIWEDGTSTEKKRKEDISVIWI